MIPSQEKLLLILQDLHARKISPEEALDVLKYLPYSDLGFAKVDTHRRFRTGFPEVVLCSGKTPTQVAAIGKELYKADGYFVGSRASDHHAAHLKKIFKNVRYDENARMVMVGKLPVKKQVPGIAVLTAGTADIPVAEEAAVTAELRGNKVERIYDVGVAGVHRLLDTRPLVEKSRILIVVAGMEGALPSLVAGLFGKPVIAVPTSVGYGANFQGLSALLTMLNSCALGIAVVNIDNGLGAGYLASLLNKTERS